MDQNACDARQVPMVRSRLVEEAGSRGIDIVQAAEAGIAHAVSRAADREAWRHENLACHAGLQPPSRRTGR